MTYGPKPIPVLERLARKSEWVSTTRSDEIGDCLVWTGALNNKGYGWINVRRHKTLVHRAAWIARHGEPPPETPRVLHHCDNPPCWREEHLWLGTQKDNQADMARKGRARGGADNRAKTHCPKNHPYDEENTYWHRGKRYCKACMKIRNQRYRRERKERHDRSPQHSA